MTGTSRGTSRERAEELDRTDPLAPLRDHFELPPGWIYLDGNSLGPPTRAARARVRQVVEEEWRRDLIGSWNVHGWIELPRRVGERIAPLVGAGEGEVIAADSTSVNLFKLLSAAVELRPDRRVLVTEAGHFPTDLYLARALADLRSGVELRRVELGQLEAAIDERVAVVSLGHVDFRSGELRDMARWTAAAHDRGALVLWDLSHSAGALPVALHDCDADLAVGCGYKFLNGGPGAPAFLYVARRHQERARTPLPGWLGHADPFAFDPDYRPAPGVDRFQCGTPPILSLAALDAALGLFDGVDLAEVRRKSVALGELFLERVEELRSATLGLEVASPPDPERRGSQVTLRHPRGYEIVQALIERGVVGDFRAPDLLRFGLAPLYLRYVDAWDAARHLREVLEGREWDHPRFRRRGVVT